MGNAAAAAMGQTDRRLITGKEWEGGREGGRERRHITRQLCSFEVSAQDNQPVNQAWDEGPLTPARLQRSSHNTKLISCQHRLEGILGHQMRPC